MTLAVLQKVQQHLDKPGSKALTARLAKDLERQRLEPYEPIVIHRYWQRTWPGCFFAVCNLHPPR